MQRVTTLAGPPAAAKAFGGARGVARRRRLASLVCLGAVDCLNGPPSSESLPAECFPIAFAVLSTTPCPRLRSLRLRQQIRLSFASRPKESASSASPAPLTPGYGCTLYTRRLEFTQSRSLFAFERTLLSLARRRVSSIQRPIVLFPTTAHTPPRGET